MITWVSESWWSNSIDEKMIKLSFKKAGINLNLNGSEDVLFNWPKQPEMLLIEDIKKIKQNNFTNHINYENNSINNYEDKDSDNDILFDYDRYDIKNIRNEVYNDLKDSRDSKMDIDEIDFNNLEKDYNYYYSFGLIK